MMHHKAPHRPWEPTAAYTAEFATKRVPEPVTLWDSYATRTDALHENQQRVAADLTNRDLKLPPPPGLAGPDLTLWNGTKPNAVTVVRDGQSVVLAGEALVRWKYQRCRSSSGDQARLFDLVNDPYERHNLYGEQGQEALTATLKAELARLKKAVRDDDQLADVQIPNGVDGPVARLRGK